MGAKELTRAGGVPFFLHLAETRGEVEELRRRTGLSPAAHLDRLGVLDEKTVAVLIRFGSRPPTRNSWPGGALR